MDAPPKFTYDFFMGQLRLIAVGLIAYAAGRGWLSSTDATFAAQILGPVALLAGPWIWSIYRNLGSKLVPSNSIAVAPEAVANHQTAVASGVAVIKDGNGGTPVKVVGCLLAALMLWPLLNSPSFAQVTPRPRPVLTGNPIADVKAAFGKDDVSTASTTTGNSAFDSAFSRLANKLQEIEKAVVDKAIADVAAARDDAAKNDDAISLPCWEAHLIFLNKLPSQWENPPTFRGIALSIQIQRDLMNAITGTDKTSIKVACAALYGDQLATISKLGLLFGAL